MLLRIFGVIIILIPFPPNWGGDEHADVPASAALENARSTRELEPPAAAHVFPTSELGATEILDHLRA